MFKCKCRRFDGIFCDLVAGMEIHQCPAVGGEVSVKFPFPTQVILKQDGIATTYFIVGPVIGTHEAFNLCFSQHFKSRKICFIQVFRGSNGIKYMSQFLRTAMNCKMFGTSRCLKVPWIIALQTFDNGGHHGSGKKRILAVCLLSPAPAGVSEDIDIGSPESKSSILETVSFLYGGVIKS